MTIFIAPFIDMVLVLLIFFMATSHFNAASGVPIQLPSVGSKTPEDKREKITLVIDRSGQLFLEGEKLAMDGLGGKLSAIRQEKGLVSLVIQADKNVPHGTVVEAMDVAKATGINMIVIAAQWRPKRSL